jgi:hypothetical protein
MGWRKKKDTLRPEKKKIQSSVCWVRGSDDYDRKKKDTVVCLLSARFWRLRPEKKKIQSSHHLPALISSYLAGDNTSSKKLPATEDSTV